MATESTPEYKCQDCGYRGYLEEIILRSDGTCRCDSCEENRLEECALEEELNQ